MSNYTDPVLEYLRLITSWPVLAFLCFTYLVRHPELLERIVSVDIAGVKVRLKKLQARISEQDQKIEGLDQELSEAKALLSLAEGAAGRSPEELQQARVDIRQGAAALQGIDFVVNFLGPDATADQIYTAAQVIRARPEPRFFAPVVDCISRLASDPNLRGVRLHFVYQLVQALHRLLVNDQDHSAKKQFSSEDLRGARAVLQTLWDNARVASDEEANPGRSVRRPIDWCLKRFSKMAL